MTERGAYLSLMQHYYATENCLPNDHKLLCRIAGAMTKPERDAVKVAMTFFDVKPEGLWHKRIEAELGKADGRRDTNRAIALAREAKKRAEKEHEGSTNRAQVVNDTLHENSTIPDTRHQTPEKQYSVESEGVTEVSYSEPSPRHAQIFQHSDRFPMDPDWLPSDSFNERLAFTQLSPDVHWINQIAEFATYWAGRPEEKNNQYGWENKFMKNLISNQVHREARLA
jgi:uncharacterized protein YdaU (DUF1376 family)